MIDLEGSLAALVEQAPPPPGLERVRARATQRRTRRRLLTLASAVVVVAAGIGGAVAAVSSGAHPSKLHVGGSGLAPAPAAGTERVRITLLDGAQLEISGPPALGLAALPPAFNGALGPASGDPQWGTLGHGFSVGHAPPAGLGAVVGTYPTHDGHDLVVHSSPFGVTAVVQYGDWWLSATWTSSPPAQWTAFASELNAKETADGFLVIEPTDPSWKLGPADAPDAQLGGDAYGSGEAFGFFGPGLYPAGCPRAADSTTRTPQGFPVSLTNGAWWCDPAARVRVDVADARLAGAAIRGLRVAYTDPAHAVDRITTLDGSTFDVTAPSSVLDQFAAQASVWVDGIDAPNVLNATPNLLPVSATRAPLPADAAEPSFLTADGHRFFSYHLPTECDCDVLGATYGEWLVEITVERSGGTQTMSTTDRARLASLFAAHETADGFLVIDPVAPMHLGPVGPDVVLHELDIIQSGPTCPVPLSVEGHTPVGYPVHFAGDGETWCDPNAMVTITSGYDPGHALVDEVEVRRAR